MSSLMMMSPELYELYESGIINEKKEVQPGWIEYTSRHGVQYFVEAPTLEIVQDGYRNQPDLEIHLASIDPTIPLDQKTMEPFKSSNRPFFEQWLLYVQCKLRKLYPELNPLT